MRMIYLDNAATTYPKPECVYRAMDESARLYGGNPGRGAHRLSVLAAERIYSCREALAELMDAPSAEHVVFTYNTTYALNLAIKSLLPDGAHVLISDMEHNAVVRPLSELARKGACVLEEFPTGGGDRAVLEGLKKQIRPNTGMIVCNHASNIGGRILPIREIGTLCHRRDILFVVDGAQSAGKIPISVNGMHIDALCIPGHKGLYGPQGVGVVVFGARGGGKTFIEGGTGIRSVDRDMPEFLPERYEAGTLCVPSISGLHAGLQWIKNKGITQIAEEERRLSHLAQVWLSEIPGVVLYPMGHYETGTFCFNVEGYDSHEIAKRLDENGICVRAGFHCAPLAHKSIHTGESGAVRVSIGVFNTPEDISALCDVVERIARS